MTVIERLAGLAEEASDRPWRGAPEGKPQDTILSGQPAARGERDGRDYYGGMLVAESIQRADRDLIVEAVNALPAFLALARAEMHRHEIGSLADTETGVALGCPSCIALAPLLAEAPA